jgi:hypothetical protein
LLRGFVVAALIFVARLAVAAPTITAVTPTPATLTVGAEVTVRVEGQNIGGGVVYVDFRPAVARMIRLTLAPDGNAWSVKGTIPTDLGLTADGQVTLRVICTDASGAQTTHTQQVPISARPPVKIVFAQATYSTTPATPFTAQVLIQGTPQPQLFSFAIEVQLTGDNISGNGLTLVVPAALNYNGPRAGGALVGYGGNTAFAKGTVNYFATPPAYHSDTLLSTINFSGLPAGTYSLTVKGYPTLGATESLFVDNVPQVLDGYVTYGAATVNVVAVSPSPTPDATTGTANPPPSSVGSIIPSAAILDTGVNKAAPALAAAGAHYAVTFATESGHSYFVQHSPDLETWTTCLPVVVGDGKLAQWVDRGPPDTESPPEATPRRFYRVLKIEKAGGKDNP